MGYVTPDVIFGTGNSNGNFTINRSGGMELGLRAKIPFTGTINNTGNGTYTYTLAEANPRWNFDWTVNTDFNGMSGNKIGDFSYQLGIDFDPSQGTNFLVFDPITPNASGNPPPLDMIPFYDHSIGDNSTPNGGGIEAGDAATYANLIANNNVLQQSWRHAFFPFHPTLTYDPTIDGTYDVFLRAYDQNGFWAGTQIRVIVGQGGAEVPEPSSIALFAIVALILVAFVWLRSRKAVLAT